MFIKKNRDIICGALTVVFGVVYLFMTLQIPIKNAKTWSSAAFPQIYGIALCLIGLVILLQAVIKKKNEAEAGEDGKILTVPGVLRVGFSFLVLIACVAMMQTLGFIPCAFLYMFVHFAFLGKSGVKAIILYAISAAVISAVIYVTFVNGFGLLLPSGRIF